MAVANTGDGTVQLTNAERETHFNIAADDRHMCEIFTDDPVWCRKLLKWFRPYKTTQTGVWFRVPTKVAETTEGQPQNRQTGYSMIPLDALICNKMQ